MWKSKYPALQARDRCLVAAADCIINCLFVWMCVVVCVQTWGGKHRKILTPDRRRVFGCCFCRCPISHFQYNTHSQTARMFYSNLIRFLFLNLVYFYATFYTSACGGPPLLLHWSLQHVFYCIQANGSLYTFYCNRLLAV